MSDRSVSPMPEEEPCCNLSKKVKICLGVLVCAVVAAIVAVVVKVPKWRQEPKQWKGAGTTPHFPEIVLGRCYTYTQVLRPELSNINCQKIEKAFRSAFVSKDPCVSAEKDYQPLMKLTNQTIPCHKTVFWSKSYELVHQYTGVQKDLFTLEDTLLGYIADGLQWCGDAGSSELNYQSCPDRREDCRNNTMSVFWDAVSKRLAENACGVVHVVLNGSISNTFDIKRYLFHGILCARVNTASYDIFQLQKDILLSLSTFGRVEIHNLQPQKVPTLQAWLMHDIGGAHSHSCSSSIINDLKLILNKRNIVFTCLDDYRPIRFLQCVKNPDHSFCRSVS